LKLNKESDEWIEKGEVDLEGKKEELKRDFFKKDYTYTLKIVLTA
jgi:hypothetical protein